MLRDRVGMAVAFGLGSLVSGRTDAGGEPPVDDVAFASPDEEDHHRRPPGYDELNLEVPPAADEAPQYPLAAQFVPADSSNYNAGGMSTVQYVVVHTMQGSYAGSISWFQNPTSDVSAHFCMRSEDGEITQMVRLEDKAWHVGSENAVAIGIEHEGFVDDASWYTWAMYTKSAMLSRWLADYHALPLDRDHIVGHVELPNQTHTDPGPNWNWDLYMALVHDVVAAGAVEGVVVDAGRACTLTATQDTWVKATLQDAEALAESDKCLVAAGTELTAYASSDDIYGHRRLTQDGTGPCTGALATEGFVVAEHFTGTCSPNQVAAVGAEISLDGGAAIAIGDDGRFAIADVGEGAHAIDASGAGYLATSMPFDQAIYPGRRLVIVLQPEASATSGVATEGGDDAADDGDDGDDGTDDGSTPEPATTDDGGDDGIDPALPGTFGEREDDATGCACRAGRGRAGRQAAPLFLAFAALGAGMRRRPRARPVRGARTTTT